MRPLFTVHAGELLAGEYDERRFRSVNVWVPSRDSGVDLLVTDRANHRAVSLQVKLSRDFLVTDTGDQNLQFQQNPDTLPIAIIVLVAINNRIETLRPPVPRVLETPKMIRPGQLVRVGG